jgi:hypothetical protein
MSASSMKFWRLTRTSLCSAVMLLALAVTAPAATAATITVSSSAATVTVGSLVQFDVVANLGPDEFISAFDLDVGFDPGLLAFESLVIGDSFGDDALTGFLAIAGILDFYLVSLVSDLDLLAAQSGSVLLARLFFTALGPGATGVGVLGPLDDPFLSLFGSDELPISGLQDANVTVSQAVPAPASLTLLVMGLAGLGTLRRRRR